jgi:hypothetical protein
LFLIEDGPHGELTTACSGYSGLLLLAQTLVQVPAYKKDVISWRVFNEENETKRRFAQDPVGTLAGLGAQFGAERRIRALYRVRAICIENGAPTESSVVTIGYPIVIEEA